MKKRILTIYISILLLLTVIISFFVAKFYILDTYKPVKVSYTTESKVKVKDEKNVPDHKEVEKDTKKDNITNSDNNSSSTPNYANDGSAKAIFLNKNALVVGDSMGEGLSAYGALDKNSVVFHRGRRIDNMKADMPTVIEKNPSYLFLAYGANDLKNWNGNVDGFINAYRTSINYIKSVLPNTKIIINSVLPTSSTAQSKTPAFTYQSAFNEALKNLTSELGVDFLENSMYLSDDSYSPDGIHPKSFFFHKWAEHMAEYLNNN